MSSHVSDKFYCRNYYSGWIQTLTVEIAIKRNEWRNSQQYRCRCCCCCRHHQISTMISNQKIVSHIKLCSEWKCKNVTLLKYIYVWYNNSTVQTEKQHFNFIKVHDRGIKKNYGCGSSILFRFIFELIVFIRFVTNTSVYILYDKNRVVN